MNQRHTVKRWLLAGKTPSRTSKKIRHTRLSHHTKIENMLAYLDNRLEDLQVALIIDTFF